GIAGMPPAELLRLGLWYERLGFEKEALECMSELAARPAEDAAAAWEDAAAFFKRRKRWQEATRLWTALSSHGRLRARIEPCIELAIAYEHRLKDVDAALYWTDEALLAVERRLALSRAGE